MTEKEILQLADDGCPHAEVEMTAEEIVADPAQFIERAKEGQTYCMFVPFSPPVLRAMIGKEFCVNINPFRFLSHDGSLIETMCKADYDKLYNRFYPPQQEYNDGTEEETRGN